MTWNEPNNPPNSGQTILCIMEYSKQPVIAAYCAGQYYSFGNQLNTTELLGWCYTTEVYNDFMQQMFFKRIEERRHRRYQENL